MMKGRVKRSRRFGIPHLTLLMLFLVPFIACILRCPEEQIEARTGFIPTINRGGILDRTGTLFAFSERDPYGAMTRIYPYGDHAKTIIGEVDQWGRGISGVELAMEDVLSKGKDVALSIERTTQMISDKVLKLQLRAFKASSGCFIIMDCETGEILAISNAEEKSPFSTPTMSMDIAHAPVFHPSLLTIALQILEEHANIAEGPSIWGRHKWTALTDDFFVWGPWKTQVLEEWGEKREAFTQKLMDLGFGEPINTKGGPDEPIGKVPLYPKGIPDEGFTASPLHILRAFTALVNRNGLVNPHFVMGNENTKTPQKPIPWLQLLQKKHLLSMFSGFAAPTLASVWTHTLEGKKKGKENEIIALGFWPSKAPKVTYITAIKDARIHPIKRPGYLSKAKDAIVMGALVPKGNLLVTKNTFQGKRP